MKPSPLHATLATILVGALGACAAPADTGLVGTSENLLVADDELSGVTKVEADRLLVPLRGHEDLLRLPAGKILVGKRALNGTTDNGFLRKVTGTEASGDTIVIHTAAASLTDAITNGEIATRVTSRQAMGDAPGLGQAMSGLKPQTLGQALRNANFSGAVVLAQTDILGGTGALSTGGIHVDETVKVEEGTFSFVPDFDTGLKFRHGKLDHFHMLATADLDVKFVLDVDVKADVDIEADLYRQLKPQKSKKRLFSLPRFRLPPQLIGILPVYEAVEIDVDFGCDFHFKGEVHLKTGVEMSAHISVGAAYQNGQWSRLGAEPRIQITPVWSAQMTGDTSIVCYVEPMAAFLFYDIAGPYIGVGPYLDTEISKTATGTEFGLYPGISGEFGADLSLFDRELAFGSIPLFDAQSKTPILASAHPPKPK